MTLYAMRSTWNKESQSLFYAAAMTDGIACSPSTNETWMPETLSFLQSAISLLIRLNRASPMVAAATKRNLNAV